MREHIKALIETTVYEAQSANPHDIAAYFGIQIVLFPFKVLKGLILTLSGQTFIAINQSLDGHEQRAVLAHELGHFVLSPRYYGYFYVTANTNLEMKLEREANLFAAGLLAHGQSPELDETFEEYGKRLGVPVELVRYLKEV
jgi:hypothetical protein